VGVFRLWLARKDLLVAQQSVFFRIASSSVCNRSDFGIASSSVSTLVSATTAAPRT
jgi:hypothetical protein